MGKSLGFKLNLALLIITTLLLTLFGIWNVTQIREQETTRLQNDLDAMSARLQTSLPQALWDFNSTNGDNAIRSEIRHAALLAIEVMDNDGKSFVQVKSEAAESYTGESETRTVELQQADGDKLVKVGQVSLQFNQEPVRQAVNSAITQSLIMIVVLNILLALTLSWMLRLLVLAPLKQVLLRVNDIAKGQGDLTLRVDYAASDELGDLSVAINQFISHVQSMVKEINRVSAQLASSAKDSLRANDSLVTELQQNQQHFESLTAALHQMNATANEVARNSNDTAQHVAQSQNHTQTGIQQVQASSKATHDLAAEVGRSAEAIDQLQQQVTQITNILDVIRSIAEQTNLLALNAAIEAARAGEQGRGFAVVADEVRTLASRTQKSTSEVHSTLDQLQQFTDSAVAIMRSGQQKADTSIENANQAAQSIQRILDSVNLILDMSNQIATAAEQQSATLTEIDRNVVSIHTLHEQTVSVSRSNSESSQHLMNVTDQLTQLVKNFKT